MVKTHLPQHMDSVREKWRPKHQLLILKCYPRLPKNSAADVSPNGSELSYLLYYASTRRSKLQKVGAFLERKTTSDVSRWQSARVFVTLQILTALLEHKVVGSGSAFGLIAPYVLRIIQGILEHTNDVSLVEACLDTWDVFCKHQDQASLAADHEYRALYENVVRQWAIFAQKSGAKKLGKDSKAVTVPDAIRLRKAGLNAIKSILTSDTLSSEVGRQLNRGIPGAILTNLRREDAFSLNHLIALSKRGEDEERDKAANRRQSMATVRTFTGNESTMSDPRAAEGTAQDADELAEEETAVLAVDCLKKIFDSDNRAQVRAGTSALLTYLARRQSTQKAASPVDWTSWSAKLFETITTWTPVQERFIVLVTATETLIRLPLSEEHVSQHLLVLQLIDDILRSDLNLIGLSVMDILLGFVQQILRILQMGAPGSSLRPSPSAEEMARVTTTNTLGTSTTTPSEQSNKATAITPDSKLVLLARLKSCISDLATHVYYTDQITDMVAAILLRLKPSASPTSPPNPAATAAAIQEPTNTVTDAVSQTSLLRERSASVATASLAAGFLTFDTARQIALESVKDILSVANVSRTHLAGTVAESRNPVPLSVWEGTQWLLRDPAPNVRRAYVDALCTWLAHETRKSDARVQEAQPLKTSKANGASDVATRRAVSSASQKESKSRKARNTFLQLLHLAVYENALQHAETSESDILLLHLLLVSTVPKLGVNAVQSALPMILTLQEDIARVPSAVAKIRIGSLVHGYFWQLAEQFEFGGDYIGRDIFHEITRRKHHSMWMLSIGVPPNQLDRIPLFDEGVSTVPEVSSSALQYEAIRPLDHRQSLVDRIAEGYAAVVTSPAPSTPGSPGRFSSHSLDRSASSYLTAKRSTMTALPDKAKEAMMAVWTKEGTLAAIAANAPKEPSVTGSQSTPSAQVSGGNHRQLLASMNDSDRFQLPQVNTRPLLEGQTQPQQGSLTRALHSQDPDRRPSGSTQGRRGSSAEGSRIPLKVDELKRVLTNSNVPVALIGRFDAEESDSDSMVDVGGEDLEGSEASYRPPSERFVSSMMGSVKPRAGKAPMYNDDHPTGHSRLNGSVSGKASLGGHSQAGSGRIGGRKDLSAILDGIELGDQSSRKYGLGRPPY